MIGKPQMSRLEARNVILSNLAEMQEILITRKNLDAETKDKITNVLTQAYEEASRGKVSVALPAIDEALRLTEMGYKEEASC